MNKDVIYIDVEDDVTAVIGKIKASKERIVALVPPRRAGILQSAVNMRLLARTAKTADKRLVLVSSDQVLAGLAASAEIPVAKTLQSKPEMAEVPVLKVDDNDVIDGSELPVGALADQTKERSDKDRAVDAVAASDTDKNLKPSATKSTKPKVPNFNIFRKKFVLIGGGVVLFIGILIWALIFAPSAKVIITAKTTSVTVSDTVALNETAKTDAKTKVIKALKQQKQKELSVDFEATGKKNVGEKAKGAVRMKTDAATILVSGLKVPSGTEVQSSGGSIFITTEDAVFSKGDAGALSGVVVNVVAKEGGSQYNGASGSASTSARGVSSVSFSSTTSGGTDKTATVVSESDLRSAQEKLAGIQDNELKKQLTTAFGSSSRVISESYTENRSNPTPSVVVGGEASGRVSLKTTVTASMIAVDQSEIDAFAKAKISEEIKGKQSQKIYSTGADKVAFSQFAANGASATVKMVTNGAIGPEIKEDQVKEQSKGKTYGEIQSSLESIEGVNDVDIKFSFFWVRTVPNDANKISVEFKLQNASS